MLPPHIYRSERLLCAIRMDVQMRIDVVQRGHAHAIVTDAASPRLSGCQ
jgi:hypothetical protein